MKLILSNNSLLTANKRIKEDINTSEIARIRNYKGESFVGGVKFIDNVIVKYQFGMKNYS